MLHIYIPVHCRTCCSVYYNKSSHLITALCIPAAPSSHTLFPFSHSLVCQQQGGAHRAAHVSSVLQLTDCFLPLPTVHAWPSQTRAEEGPVAALHQSQVSPHPLCFSSPLKVHSPPRVSVGTPTREREREKKVQGRQSDKHQAASGFCFQVDSC